MDYEFTMNENQSQEEFIKQLELEMELARKDKETSCHTPDPTGYFDLSKIGADDANVLSMRLPSKNGIAGTVVPRATKMGGSQGYNPHKPTGVVHIDPDDRDGHACTLDFSKLDKETVNATYAYVKDKMGDADQRLIASQVFSRLAADITPKPKKVVSVRMPNWKKDGTESVKADYPLPEYVPTPIYQATFEVSGFGQIKAMYSEIVVGDCLLVLAFDTRCTTSAEYMPHKSDYPMLVAIPHLNKVFKVQSVGINFKLEHNNVCVLLIEDEADLTEEDDLGENRQHQ